MGNPKEVSKDQRNDSQTFASPNTPDEYANGTGKNDRLSGPQYLSTIKPKNGRKYCLDLSGKYNKDSNYKQYHCATFVFRNVSDASQKQDEGAILTMALPNKVKYSFGGRWQNQFSSLNSGAESMIGGLAGAISSGAFNGSFDIATATTWVGTQELSMILSFPVFDDVADGSGVNLQEALALLAEASLPDSTSEGMYTKLPGPTVWQSISHKDQEGKTLTGKKLVDATQKALSDMGEFAQNKISNVLPGFGKDLESNPWQRITLQLGGILLIDWCIIKKVSVEFPNTKHQVLHSWENVQSDQRQRHLQPLLANVEIEISTVQGLTVSKFLNMLQLSEGTKRNLHNSGKTTTNNNLQLSSQSSPIGNDETPQLSLNDSSSSTYASTPDLFAEDIAEIGGMANSMKIKGPTGAMIQYLQKQGME